MNFTFFFRSAKHAHSSDKLSPPTFWSLRGSLMLAVVIRFWNLQRFPPNPNPMGPTPPLYFRVCLSALTTYLIRTTFRPLHPSRDFPPYTVFLRIIPAPPPLIFSHYSQKRPEAIRIRNKPTICQTRLRLVNPRPFPPFSYPPP